MEFLTDGIMALTWQQLVMYAVGITLIWLAIKKGFEPALLLPMGFGAILVNLPFSGVVNQTLTGGIQANGVIEWMFHVGIEASEVMPILLFIGIGAMIDFGPLLSGPSLFYSVPAHSLEYLRLFSWLPCLDFVLQMRPLLELSVQQTDQPPFWYPRFLAPGTSAPLQWQPIPTWLWFPLCSPSPSALSLQKKNAAFTWITIPNPFPKL